MYFDSKNLVRTCAALAVSLALAIGVMACGSSSDSTSSGGSDEDQVTETITNAIEKSDESLCTEYFTLGFVEQISGKKGDEAIAECEKSLKADTEQNNTDVKVTAIKVDGDDATAKATFKVDGKDQSATFTLKREDEAWKIDSTGA